MQSANPAPLTSCLTSPRSQLLGLHLARTMPKLHRMPELDALVSEIMDGLELAAVEALPHSVPLVDQSTMQIAYYQQRSKLPESKVASSGIARVSRADAKSSV